MLKMGDSAKVLIKQDMKGRKHKYGFNNNKREKTEKKRVVNDETGDKHQLDEVLRRQIETKNRCLNQRKINGIERPKRQGNCRTKKCGDNSLSEDVATALIKLLCEGSPTGKKDAATAIFNLSIYQGNKPRAVKAGIVAPPIQFLKDVGGGMVDEAVAIMAILASHHEGRVAIGQAKPIHILVEVIRTGSPRNRENAASRKRSPVCDKHELRQKEKQQ
ncbi:hypothetical protein JHK87_042943 [Glycine soja]|nr:hypothetical protein JHK87_042943 [Glycine soja]